MAFGKDPSQLQNMPTFGGTYAQRAKSAAARPERKAKGSGGAFYWKDTFKLDAYEPTFGRIIAGSYVQPMTYDNETVVEETLPFFKYREHHNGKRGAICSAGVFWTVKGRALPCHGCDIFWEDVRERKEKKARGDKTEGPNRMSCRDQYAFTFWDYGAYIEVPDTDQHGRPRLSQKTGKPYTSWVKGNPNDPRYAGMTWKQGHLLAWPMSQAYHDVLVAYSQTVGATCRSCGTRGSIQCVEKLCSNPACNQVIYSPQSCTLSAEQRDKIDNYPYACPRCNVTGFVAERLFCPCGNPQRTQLWEVDLQLQAVPTGKGKQTILQVMNYSEPRPIQVADSEVLKTIVPLDLAKKFAPTPLEVQKDVWGL